MAHWPLIVISLLIFITQCQRIDDSPTLIPVNPFLVDDDVQVLLNELEHNHQHTDLGKVIQLLFHRTFEQRMQINDNYNNKSDNHLNVDLWDKSDKPLDKLFRHSLWLLERLLVNPIHDVIIHVHNEPVGAVEEIVCGTDKAMKAKMTEFYRTSYDGEADLGKTLGDFRSSDGNYTNVIKKYCWDGLGPDKIIIPEDADKEARELRAIDVAKEQEQFIAKLNELLGQYGEADMQKIFRKYRRGPNDGINDAVLKLTSRTEITIRAYSYLVRHIEDPCLYWADELELALQVTKKGKINIDKIDRIVLTRCERDLGCILQSYKDNMMDKLSSTI